MTALVRYTVESEWARRAAVEQLVDRGFDATSDYRYGPGHHVVVEVDDDDATLDDDAAEITGVILAVAPSARRI